MQEFYKKSDIIKMLEELKPVPCRIYSTLREMADAENYSENGDNYDDVESYTTYAISPPNYVCACVDEPDGGNELFVEFDKNDYPIAYYELVPFRNEFNEIKSSIRQTIEYLRRNGMIPYKEHPSISVAETMKLLENDEDI